jgi:ubiquinone/menaquinone biosynthesis C-methylase UbiE
MTDTDTQRHYLPAAGKDWALPLYDPFVKLFGGDSARKVLIDQAALSSGLRILDIGCGTGTMVVLIKRLHPDVTAAGLDPDPKALARARHKADRDGLSIQFDRGFSDQLPYPDASFDRVFSSLMYHHLPPDEKYATLREVHRVLRPGASFHLMDFLGPDDHRHGFLSHILHAGEHFQDNSASEILARLQQAGFPAPQKLAQRRLIFGPIAYYQAAVPVSQFF